MASARVSGGCRALMAAAKSVSAGASGRSAASGTKAPQGPNFGGTMKTMPVSMAARKFLGVPEISRLDAVKKICDYVKIHQLQEGRLLAFREFSTFQRAFTLSTTMRINFPLRHLSTVGEPEKAVIEDSVASNDVVQPQRIKFKRLDKTARHIMNIVDKEEVDKVKGSREIPDIRPGYIVQLKVEVPENKRRVSTLKGIVIARRNAGLQTTFRLRRMVAGVGVESVFPLYSPNIKEMKVLDKKDVRRAKLYYLRDRMNALKSK